MNGVFVRSLVYMGLEIFLNQISGIKVDRSEGSFSMDITFGHHDRIR